MIRIYWQKEIPNGAEHQRGMALLAELLPEGKEIKKGPFGKPYLKGGPFFNLSHSGGFLAIAIADREIGIDLEAPREIRHRGFIREGEEGIDPLTLWVIKESFMKWTGEGLRQFRAVRAEPLSENLYRVTDGKREAFSQTFRLDCCIGAVTAEKIEEIKMAQI